MLFASTLQGAIAYPTFGNGSSSKLHLDRGLCSFPAGFGKAPLDGTFKQNI